MAVVEIDLKLKPGPPQGAHPQERKSRGGRHASGADADAIVQGQSEWWPIQKCVPFAGLVAVKPKAGRKDGGLAPAHVQLLYRPNAVQRKTRPAPNLLLPDEEVLVESSVEDGRDSRGFGSDAGDFSRVETDY